MRQGFNWSLLDRYNLYSMLYTAGRDIIGKKMPVTALHQHLSSHIKSILPVKVTRRQYDPTQARGFPYMGGLYDSDADNAGKNRFISIILAYNPLDKEVRITEYVGLNCVLYLPIPSYTKLSICASIAVDISKTFQDMKVPLIIANKGWIKSTMPTEMKWVRLVLTSLVI